ncbi:uncharacterized protein AC631_05226 [Debaryomyces fabryi]|uniref:TRIP4/RQT4 C2HC5-type zinc finger domain-containing protein n=1 Tax=Debaryomyces fabryi TaxID=58627 RepID=A0A0V1PS22_9ASCO|nr:uncharacterized protein AC631_05226 [Debaryomyces fabryi]KRZ99018.1 hypothetical protein AC631_05226 [Debaryomyces fabryi]CUM49355.1 unnamed protein product [Debaryomyces fabryi]
MNYTKLKSFSANAISNILPVDHETCSELVDYALTLQTDHEIQSHFLNLLGESDETLAFLTKFMALKKEADDSSKQMNNMKNKSAKAKKESTEMPPANNTKKNHKAWTSPSESVEHQQKGRLENNKTSKTTSQLLDLRSPSPVVKPSKSSKKKRLDNLQDIEAVLNDLEIASRDDIDMESSSVIKRKCNCMGRRHPLFEVAPNCLNCGKIICAKEGLQPCSFCGKELLSFKDKWEIINLLREEKTNIESKQDPSRSKSSQDYTPTSHSKNKNKKIVVTLNAGENLWRAQDTALKKMESDKKRDQELLEKIKKEREEIAQQAKELQHYEETSKINPELVKAQERLETLLAFQATGAERTKIIDNASDFEMPNSNSGNMWLSPMERALHLKKQQKQLRKNDGIKKARSGRGNKTVEMVIKDGKVTMVEKQAGGSMKDDDESEDEEIIGLENKVKESKSENENASSKNIWDYNKYNNRWEKPLYIPSENDFPKIQNTDQQTYKPRVQFSNDAEENELLITLPS